MNKLQMLIEAALQRAQILIPIRLEELPARVVRNLELNVGTGRTLCLQGNLKPWNRRCPKPARNS